MSIEKIFSIPLSYCPKECYIEDLEPYVIAKGIGNIIIVVDKNHEHLPIWLYYIAQRAMGLGCTMIHFDPECESTDLWGGLYEFRNDWGIYEY